MGKVGEPTASSPSLPTRSQTTPSNRPRKRGHSPPTVRARVCARLVKDGKYQLAVRWKRMSADAGVGSVSKFSRRQGESRCCEIQINFE